MSCHRSGQISAACTKDFKPAIMGFALRCYWRERGCMRRARTIVGDKNDARRYAVLLAQAGDRVALVHLQVKLEHPARLLRGFTLQRSGIMDSARRADFGARTAGRHPGATEDAKAHMSFTKSGIRGPDGESPAAARFAALHASRCLQGRRLARSLRIVTVYGGTSRRPANLTRAARFGAKCGNFVRLRPSGQVCARRATSGAIIAWRRLAPSGAKAFWLRVGP